MQNARRIGGNRGVEFIDKVWTGDIVWSLKKSEKAYENLVSKYQQFGTYLMTFSKLNVDMFSFFWILNIF